MIIAIPFRGPQPNKIRCKIASQILKPLPNFTFFRSYEKLNTVN